MFFDVDFKTCAAMLKARRVRKAVAKLYRRNPGRAIDHVNAKLDEANRAEWNHEIEQLPVTL